MTSALRREGAGVPSKADIVSNPSKGGCVNLQAGGRGSKKSYIFADVINGSSPRQRPILAMGRGTKVSKLSPSAVNSTTSVGPLVARSCPPAMTSPPNSGLLRGLPLDFKWILKSNLYVQGDPTPCSKPCLDIKTKVPFSMRPMYKYASFVLVSTGGWELHDVSPCIDIGH